MSGEQHSRLQQRRLAQLHAMEPGELNRLMEQMASAYHLPRFRLHFRKHGLSLDAADETAYERMFREHIRRQDLRWFTFIRPQSGDAIWYLVAPDSGAIAIYNETRGAHWSFFRNLNLSRLLESRRGKWVEVISISKNWRFQPW